MNSESNSSFLFGTVVDPPVQWRSYATSMGVHIGAIILLLLIPMAITHEVKKYIHSDVALYVPPVKPYTPPPKIRPPKLSAKLVAPPKPLLNVPPAVVKPVVAPPVIKEIQKPAIETNIAAAEPKPLPRSLTPEVAPAPAIKPQVHTGIFGSEEAAKKVEVAKQLKVGGFGDPNGVKTSPDAKNPTLLAKVGSFEMPQGDGASGGHGGQGRGVVRQSSFGSLDAAGSGSGGNGLGNGHSVVRQSGFGSPDGGGGNGTGGNGHGGTVKTGGFGETTTAAPVQTQRARPTTPTTTPVEILSKPRPVYTAEARSLHLEGEIALEVVFSASGAVQVIRVVQGLGHGLDQAAEQAASQIRFHPGTRDGAPVDTKATIHIMFQLT